MLKLVIQVLTKFLLYTKAGGIKSFKLFLFSTFILVLNIAILLVSSSAVLAVTGDYNKDINNNKLQTSEWNKLPDEFVDQDGDTMTGNLNIFRSSGDNAELQLESVTGNHWGLYHDRTSNDLRFWNVNDLFTFTDSGNFGIGTNNPSRLLSIFSGLSGKGMEIRSPNPALWFIDTTDTTDAWSIYNQGADDGLAFRSEDISGSGRTTRLFLKHSNGYVGIGTTSPNSRLTVIGVRGGTGIQVNDGSYPNLSRVRLNVSSSGHGQIGLYTGTNNQNVFFTANGNSYFNGGNVSIGTVTPAAKLDVAGQIKVGSFGGDANAVPKSYIDSVITGSTYWSPNGDDIYNSNVGNVGIGIGTTAPGSLLTIANDNWISAVNSDGTGYVNMFKVNTNNQLELGTAINAGNFEFAPDSGYNTFVDMAVTSAPAVGTVEGYSLKLDGNNILSIYSEANGSGGIQNEAVGIGTSSPSSKLTLADGDFEMTNNKSIKIQNATASTTLLIGNYADGSGFSYGSNYAANLAVEGDVKGNRICIGEDCKATWSGIVSGGMPAGTSGQTLRHNGSDWIANSTIYNDGTSVGIATSTPGTELDVVGDVSASMYYDRDNTNYYVNPDGNITNYSAIFKQNVGIGTTSPGQKLEISSSDNPGIRIRETSYAKYFDINYFDSGGLYIAENGNRIAQFHPAQQGLIIGGGYATGAYSPPSDGLLVQGNVGIGTTSPLAKLDIQGTDVGATKAIIVRNSAGTDNFSVSNNGQVNIQGSTNIVPMSGGSAYIQIRNNATGYMTVQGDTSYGLLLNPNGGSVGIATTTPISKLDVNGLIKMRNYTITEPEDVINKAYLDGFDPGLWLANGNNIYNTNSDNVGIGTNTPTSKLTLENGDFEMTNNKSIKIENSTASTTLHIGNYGDGGGFSYDTGYRANLAVEGDVKGNRICIREDCKATWSGIVSGGMPTGTSGQTLRHNGSDWVANSTIFNNGTDVGIGTAIPGTELDVVGNVSASMYYDRDNTNYYVDPEGTAFNYSAIFNKSVGIGTTSPAVKLAVAGEIQMGSTGTTCDASKEGAYRYNEDSEQTQMCNGQMWINVSGCGVAVDEDGNKYGTVEIGGQCWLAENLNVGTMLATGSTEPNTSDAVIEKWCYNNDPALCEADGGLYNWNEAMRGSEVAGAQGICMEGWHIPTDNEINILENYVVDYINSVNPQYPCSISETGWRRCADDSGTDAGGTYGAGNALRQVGLGSGVGSGTDLVGWSGNLPGHRRTDGSFYYHGSSLYLWSSSEYSSTGAWRRLFNYSRSVVDRHASNKVNGFSVRCLRD